MAKAVRIASISDNRIHMNLQVLDSILEKVGNHPVAIVSINGPMRTGKSYMLGHFLRYLSAPEPEQWFEHGLDNEFHWKSSSERQTTGILMWSQPFFIEQDNREIAVLLMDTQGCFDDKTTTNENNLIFALSCLLSSVLIYNVKGQLTEDVLQFLLLFIDFAKISMEYTSSEPFSKLIFLIRDWDIPNDFKFGYYDNKVSAGDKNYKINKLDVREDMASEVKVVHQGVLSSFQSVGCCLMPYPGKKLAQTDDTSCLEPEFVQTIRDFVPRVFDSFKVITKKVGGREVSGLHLKAIIGEWAKVFEKSTIPQVKDVNAATAQTQAMIACATALNYYKSEMKIAKTGTGLQVDELQKLHQTKKDIAVKLFKHIKRIKNEKIEEEFGKRLNEEITEYFESVRNINEIILRFNTHKNESLGEKKQLEQSQAEIQWMRHRVKQLEAQNQIKDQMQKSQDDTIERMKQQIEEVERKYHDKKQNRHKCAIM